MTFESALEALTDTSQRLAAQHLSELSDLHGEAARQFAETWPEIPEERRLRLVTDLTELAEDNVELNFHTIFKTALRDDDAMVRAAAIRGLYEYEGRDLIDVLADVLRNDPEKEVRREAAIALGRFALEAELGHYREDDAATIRDTLIESVEDEEEDDRVRARSLEALGALSGEETQNLIESIYHEDSMWLKAGAVDAMGRSCEGDWLPTVLQEAQNRAPEMRHAAAFAMGEIGDESTIPMLKRMALLDPDREVQLAAVHALGEIGGPPARVALKAVLYEGDDSLNDAIQEALTTVAFNEDPLNPATL